MSSHSKGQHMQKLICQKEKRGENEVRKVTQFACGVFFPPMELPGMQTELLIISSKFLLVFMT